MSKARDNNSIKKGDKVFVITGNDKGTSGVVLSRTEKTAIVQGVNVRKKSVKPSQVNPTGGFLSIERPLHLSNLKIFDEKK